MSGSELIGLAGAALAGYAYLPQITHLIRERCSSGLSERAFALWLVASLLMTVHAVTIRAVVFIVLGILQVAASGVIAFDCRRYRGRACPSHDPGSRIEVGSARRTASTPVTPPAVTGRPEPFGPSWAPGASSPPGRSRFGAEVQRASGLDQAPPSSPGPMYRLAPPCSRLPSLLAHLTGC